MANEETLGAPVQPLQEGQTGEQGTTVASLPDSSVKTQPSQSSSNETAWIGGVKKESRQKGFEEGYRAAQAEIQRQFSQPAEVPSTSVEAPPVAPSQPAPALSSTPALSSEQIAQQAAQLAAAQMQAQAYNQVDAKARQQFTDYDEKMQQLTQLVEQYDQNPATKAYANDVRTALASAANTGNPALVYQLAADENFRNDLLATHPRLWQQKLLQKDAQTLPPLSQAQQMAAQRVQGEPVQNMPQTASYGDLAEPSWAELRRRVRNN